MYPWCAAIFKFLALSFLRISSLLPFSQSFLLRSSIRGTIDAKARKEKKMRGSESKGLMITDNGLAAEENVGERRARELRFSGVRQYSWRRGRISPRKKLPKITLFRLRLVFSPLNPVSLWRDTPR